MDTSFSLVLLAQHVMAGEVLQDNHKEGLWNPHLVGTLIFITLVVGYKVC